MHHEGLGISVCKKKEGQCIILTFNQPMSVVSHSNKLDSQSRAQCTIKDEAYPSSKRRTVSVELSHSTSPCRSSAKPQQVWFPNQSPMHHQGWGLSVFKKIHCQRRIITFNQPTHIILTFNQPMRRILAFNQTMSFVSQTPTRFIPKPEPNAPSRTRPICRKRKDCQPRILTF